MRTVVVFSVVLSACGPSGAAPLDGSLTATVDVTYDRATLEATPGYLALRFQKARGEAEDTVLKVGVVIEGAVPDHAVMYDLAEKMDSGQRGTATRNVLAEPENTTFPPLSRGLFRVDGDLTKAVKVKGEVSLTFVQGNVLGSGRAVFGTFEAQVLR